MKESTLRSYTGPRPDVTRLIALPIRRVLDVGCANGTVGASLRSSGAEVWGIEVDRDLAAEAAGCLDRVLQGDALVRLSELADSNEEFDVVICADVLEHLPDAWLALSKVRDVITREGQCIVSLPNVRFYSTFTHLAFRGRWPRLDRGVHDRTHLQWFTDRDARDMFERSGFYVEKASTNYRLTDKPGNPLNRIAKLVARGPIAPFLAYQLLYRLRLN